MVSRAESSASIYFEFYPSRIFASRRVTSADHEPAYVHWIEIPDAFPRPIQFG
jgi:hypothetical protein